jgi:hypothetical protein
MTVTWLDEATAERWGQQAPSIHDAGAEILNTLRSVERYLFWTIDPEESGHDRDYYAANIIELAHILVDQAHAYRSVLLAHQALKEDSQRTSN